MEGIRPKGEGTEVMIRRSLEIAQTGPPQAALPNPNQD